MIVFKKVRWKNFLSTGNSFTEIDLNRTQSTLIVGQNGSGKSTMLDAISFGLFGKPHRSINKNQLINSINGKSTVVEVEFSIGKSEYKIIRGIKPNTFEIWQGDNLINQSSHAKEYQKILEQNILKLNHKSFHQVVVLGSSSFIPFMQLPAGHRRDVIEDLLDINVFSKMNHILRDKQNILKDQIKDINYNIDITKNKIDTQKKYIRDITVLTEENKKEYESRIQSAQNNIDELQTKNSELSLGLDESISETEKGLSTLHDKRQALLLRGQDITTQSKEVGKRAMFFEKNETCPVCDQAISDEHKHGILESAKSEAKTLQSQRRQIGEEGSSVEKEISETNDLLRTLRDKLSQLSQNNVEITGYQKQIKEYQLHLKKDVSADLEKANTDLREMHSDKEKLADEKLKISDEYSYNTAMAEMLKDTGIKTKIIKQYLPPMNKLINQYLQVLDFYVHFNLDESFQETIRSRHRDEFTYDSFSEGEKQRIDLALLFSWRQIAKMKNSANTNLLMLDETFDSSLDADGVDNLLKILYTLGKDTNVFIISHKQDLLEGKFPRKIEFEKTNNFSRMKS